VPFTLSRIMLSGLLLVVVLSVCTFWFHNMATLPSWLVSTGFGTWWYQCFLFVQFYRYFFAYVKVQSSTHAVMLSCIFMYFSFASIRYAYTMWWLCLQIFGLDSICCLFLRAGFLLLIIIIIIINHCYSHRILATQS
jgi:hypothetical protein